MTWAGYRSPEARARAAHGAPRPVLPLDDPDALEQALWLRDRGYTFPCIHKVMGDYHGHWASPDAWRERIRTATATGLP